MGHTVPPFTWQYQIEKGYFGKFRRALLIAEDRRRFDELWNKAEFHLPAAEKTSHPLPIATILMMINLEQQKMIKQLEQSVEILAQKNTRLEKALEKSEARAAVLARDLEGIEDHIEEQLKAFREEMLTIKYPDYEFAA